MNPPHSHLPIGCPTTKITLTKFVITVAAQKLICPQGNTYPTKAVDTHGSTEVPPRAIVRLILRLADIEVPNKD